MPALSQFSTAHTVAAPSDDKRWRVVGVTMRKHGYSPSGLIETLHTVQELFGYLDDPSLTYVARSLSVPLSKAYGVATFYTLFRLKPQGAHTCVVCLGTACYIKGGAKVLAAVEQCTHIKCGETTADQQVSIVTARCLGACGIAPAAVFDGRVIGTLTPSLAQSHIKEWIDK